MKIDPSLMEQIRIMQEEALMQQGMSDDQIEMAGEMMSKFQSPLVLVISSLFTFAFIGFIISLVTSIFIKRKEDENAFDEAMGEVKSEE
jgi:ABC-type antimicrobial peptide transport system permease subunit